MMKALFAYDLKF